MDKKTFIELFKHMTVEEHARIMEELTKTHKHKEGVK